MKIGIKNFRSLKDTSLIDIKPITLLLGKNSSGKSSFIRTFPMLKQSSEERGRSPILLYGDYVDFGSYKDIIPKFKEHSIDTNYELIFDITDEFKTFLKLYPSFNETFNFQGLSIFSISIKLNQNTKSLIIIESLLIKIEGFSIEIEIEKSDNTVSKIKVNNLILFNSTKDVNKIYVNYDGNLIPNFIISGTKDSFYEPDPSIIFDKRIENIFKKLNPSKSDNTLAKFFKLFIKNLNDNDSEFLIKLQSNTIFKELKQQSKVWNVDTIEYKVLRYSAIASFLFENLLSKVNHFLSHLFSGVKYLAPLRATAERYYRIQHLSINDVDPNGKNLPMFLDSLSDSDLRKFQEWTLENFNFKTDIAKIEGHYSIKIVFPDLYEVNLSDTGFGYSQILPVLTQLWYSVSNIFRKSNAFYYRKLPLPKIIAIEQPELHLHPEFQAKFADSLCKILLLAKANNVNLSLIIETHSEIIINRLGLLILDDKIKKDDINIVIFNKPIDGLPTDISFAEFTSDGLINNWPQGFFTPKI